jgi:uncharacterized repeat protein (TIGR01451 family)
MRTHQRKCTDTARRRALPGGLLPTGVLAGLLAITTFAATDSSVSLHKGKVLQKKGQRVIAIADETGNPVEGTGARPAATPATSQPAGATTLNRTEQAPAVRTLAPGNDECAGATAIADGPYPVLTAAQDISEATPQGTDSGELTTCTDSFGMDHTVWYSFTPSVTTLYTFSTCQSNGATGSTVYDTIIGVLESTGGACPGAAEVACTDISGLQCGNGVTPGAPYWDQAATSAVLTAGTTYFVVAGHWAGDPTQTGGPGVTGALTDIQIKVDRSNAPSNDTCAGVVDLPLNRAIRGTTAGASNDYQSPAACYTGVGHVPSTGPGRDVVYSFTAPSAGKYSVRWVSDEFVPPLRSQDATLYAASNCPSSGTVSCLAGANRMAPASGQNKSEELYCMSLAESQTIYVYFDHHTTGDNGGVFDIEVTRCEQEAEPNDTIATATTPATCAVEGTSTGLADVDFISLGTPPAGSRVFAGTDNAPSNNQDWEMRVTTTTDTLQYDNDDGTSIVGSNSPQIAGALTDGNPTFIRLNHRVGAAEPWRLFTRVETGAPQVETEPNDAGGGNVSFGTSQSITGGGYLRGTTASATDADCFRFVVHEGDDISIFSGANPDRTVGVIGDNWPVLYDLSDSGYNLEIVGGQTVRSLLDPSPGTLTGLTPSVTSEFFNRRARYTGAMVVCYYPIDHNPPDPGPQPAFPNPWVASISLNCGPVPAPSAANADVSITKTGPAGPVPTSGIVEYTIEVTNTSATDIAQDVRFTDDLPFNLTLLDVLVDDGFGALNIACDQLDEDLIDCTNYSIAPGATTTWTIIAQVNQCIGSGIEITNSASIVGQASTDANSANDSDSWTFTTEDGPCSDDNPCTDDACVSGSCVSTPDDTNACDDGLLCTVEDTCGGGLCSGAPNPCLDSDPCTLDQCDENDGCFNSFSEGEICDDGNPCTAVDICLTSPTEGCYGFEEQTCDDSLNCTSDSCDGAGGCIFDPLDCDDGNPCTDNTCDEVLGCVSTNNSDPCDDGNPCTVADTCGDGSCQSGGLDSCDDGNACTADSCDTASGCVNAPIGCDDGNACTADSCDTASGCVNAPIGCDDGNACTADSCDTASGCINAPIGCDDGNACTADSCDTASGCVNAPIGCDDGNACTADSCDTASGCVNAPIGCDDGNACTADSCADGSCVYEPIPGCGQECGEPNPQTRGYWKRLCNGPHSGDELTAADAACVASQGDQFADVSSVADICAVLHQNGAQCVQGEIELMSLALNICHGFVCDATPIDSQYSDNTTVGESYDEADANLPSGNCMLAKGLGSEINTGRAIDVNSVDFTKLTGGGARVSWHALGGGSTPVVRYNVWRRHARSMAAFTKVNETTNLSFDDTTPGSFEYEVTPVR